MIIFFLFFFSGSWSGQAFIIVSLSICCAPHRETATVFFSLSKLSSSAKNPSSKRGIRSESTFHLFFYEMEWSESCLKGCKLGTILVHWTKKLLILKSLLYFLQLLGSRYSLPYAFFWFEWWLSWWQVNSQRRDILVWISCFYCF